MLDWFFGLLTTAQWDAWRNWLVAIGGFIALTVALSTYRRNVRNKREEQARLVYSKFTHVEHYDPGEYFPLSQNNERMGITTRGMEIVPHPDPQFGDQMAGHALAPLIHTTVIVHNGSKELIGPARVQMVNGGSGQVWDHFSMLIGAIEPESDYVMGFTWINEFHPGQPSLATTVIFRDASGQWWRRHRAEPIERVHNDPENDNMTPVEREVARRDQEAMGIPLERRVPEPRLTWSVRWHRFWRRRAGKSAIP